MNVKAEDYATAQAIGLCWLARQKGQPPIYGIRIAVAQLHPEGGCPWCDYPLVELLKMISPPAWDGWGEKQFRGLPPAARVAAIREAQG